MAANPDNPNNDSIVADSPTDTISSVSWSPNANILVAGSWNKEVRCWEVQNNGTAVAKAMITHDAPVLCTDFSGDGQLVFSGGCCKTAKMWHLATQQQQVVAKHDAPIKALHWINDLNALATGSWDKTIRYWDTRTANPVARVELPERLYAMDVSQPHLMVAATAEGHIAIYDLRKPSEANRTMKSTLRFQTRCVATFPDQTGFAIGSIEGRVSINFLNEKQSQKQFAFKCHRNQEEVYAVNHIAFHPLGTFATCGSDGAYVFWDLVAKQRLKPFLRAKNSITCAKFNYDGSIFAYALSYDWSKGVEYHDPARPNRIMLHSVQKSEITPQSGAKR